MKERDRRKGSRVVAVAAAAVVIASGGRRYVCGELKVFKDTESSVFQALWAKEACALADRRRLGVRRDGSRKRFNSTTSSVRRCQRASSVCDLTRCDST